MKQIYIFLVCLFASIGVNAQDKVMTIDNQTPGWLSSKMTYAQQVAVEDLTVTGYINPTDMEFINGLIGKRNLKVLNLYNVVTIDKDYNDYVLWANFIKAGKTLQKLILPKVFKGGVHFNTEIDSLFLICNSDTKVGTDSKINHLILMEGSDSIPSEFFRTSEACSISAFPNTLKFIGNEAFYGKELSFHEPLVFPKSLKKIGGIKLEEEHGQSFWSPDGYHNREYIVPISKSRFDFPDSLKCYYSQIYRSSISGIMHYYTGDIFKSDTITVSEKCDSLFARLEAKYAFFYAKNPPVRDHDRYSQNIIETLYVPEGSLEAYTKEYGAYDNIGNIVEMKKVSNIALRWASPHQMVPNEHINLLFEIQPSDAFDKRLKWSSDNEEVATVDDNGEVYAHKSGTATITVTTYDGSVSNSCEIVVAKPVTGVSIEPAEVELTELGKTAQLTAKIQPEDATNKNMTWKSSNESVCMVSDKGELLTTGYGKTVVLATTEDGNYVGPCIVTVSEETGIDNTMVSSEVKEVSRFSSQGQRLTAPTKGVNIVKYSDGSVRKEIVK